MGNPAGELKKKREKRHKKHMIQLDAKYAALEAAAAAPAVAKPVAKPVASAKPVVAAAKK